MGPPHDPYGAPEKYMKLYDPAKLTMRPNWVEGTPGAGRKEVAAYYAAMTAIDDQVGRLMKAVDDSGKADDTIVVFLSDHGDMLGSHGKRLKRKPWEESIRIPLHRPLPGPDQAGPNVGCVALARRPRSDAACALRPAGPDRHAGDGPLGASCRADRSRGPIRPSSRSSSRSTATARRSPGGAFGPPASMYARTEAGPWVLYDLEDDPYEMKNLADDPAHAALRERMEAKLDRLDAPDRRFLGLELDGARSRTPAGSIASRPSTRSRSTWTGRRSTRMLAPKN